MATVQARFLRYRRTIIVPLAGLSPRAREMSASFSAAARVWRALILRAAGGCIESRTRVRARTCLDYVAAVFYFFLRLLCFIPAFLRRARTDANEYEHTADSRATSIT